jgi:hypothetical protein
VACFFYGIVVEIPTATNTKTQIMKKLTLLFAILVSTTSFSQTIYLDREIIIPIGVGLAGETLDSINVDNSQEGFKYTLGTNYNSDKEIKNFYTEWVVIDDSLIENTSLTINLSKISDTKRAAVIGFVEDGVTGEVDSTVMNYNLAGLQTSTYSYSNDSVGYELRESTVWYYPTADNFYSVDAKKDTVFYTATNGKVQLVTASKHGDEHKYEYTYNKDGMLTMIQESKKDSGVWQEKTTFTLYYGSKIITTVAHHNLSLSVFPNPTTSTIQVSSDIGCTVTIYDMFGNHIRNLNSHCNEIINLSELSKGYYIIRIADSLGGSETRKVLLR